MNRSQIRTLLTVMTTVWLTALPLAAQERKKRPPDPRPTTGAALAEMVENALPEILGDDNRDLVKRLSQARLGRPLGEGFDPDRLVGELFRGARPSFAPDCEQLQTAAGDPDLGHCTVSSGKAAGRGAYAELSFSKHMGLGTVRYVERQADREVAELTPVQRSAEDAYARATRRLVEVFGLPEEEIPKPPRDAKNRSAVRNLMVARGDESGTREAVPVKQVVSIRRGLFVGLDRLPWIPAPGKATVVMDDERVTQVTIRGWRHLRPHPQLSAEYAKGRAELVEEILDDLRAVNDAPVATLRARLLFTAVPEGTHALMVPAVEISVSPLPAELSEEEQEAVGVATAGYVRQYSLVRLTESKEDD